MLERFRHGDADVDDVADGQGVPLEQRSQARTGHDRHDQVERVFVPAEVVDGHDARMIHLRDELRLAPKALLVFG